MSPRPFAWIIRAAGVWAAVAANGEPVFVDFGARDFFAQIANGIPTEYFTIDSTTLADLLHEIPASHRPDTTLISDFDGLSCNVAGFSWVGGSRIWQGSKIFPDSVDRYCFQTGRAAVDSADPVDLARAWGSIWREQDATLAQLAGVTESSRSLSATAFKAAILPWWRRGGEYFGKTAAWPDIRRAYYGGRMECFAPDWRGQAVEYDLRNAYGWALAQNIPDWQLYHRKVLAREPGWFDATVRLTGPVGPLPVRDPENVEKLLYPTGCEVRGWWARPDLERNGVEIVEIHDQYAGRQSNELRPVVSRWLELRERATCPAARATLRGLTVGLAGKLAQRALSWGLWHASEGQPPPLSRPIGGGFDSQWFAYPCAPRHPPLTLPTTASYVTALTRQRVWPWIADGLALYTHTDSVHLAKGQHGPPCGPRAGDWSIKERGFAHYRGVNDYMIGAKRVSPFQ